MIDTSILAVWIDTCRGLMQNTKDVSLGLGDILAEAEIMYVSQVAVVYPPQLTMSYTFLGLVDKVDSIVEIFCNSDAYLNQPGRLNPPPFQ